MSARAWLVPALWWLGCAAPQQAARPHPVPVAHPQLRTAEYLPEHARELLYARMQRHGDDMLGLTATVLMLEYDTSHALATSIAEEPRLGAPGDGESEALRALLPSRFFALQDELAQRAHAVADAAADRDPQKLNAAFAGLAQTCVSCHALYLHAPSAPHD